MKKTFCKFGFSFLLLASAFLVEFPVQSTFAQAQEKLTNQDVVKMVKAGLSAEIISAAIKSAKTEFDTSTMALKELKKHGVPDSVILTMLEQKPTASNKTQETQPLFEFPNQQGLEQGKNPSSQTPAAGQLAGLKPKKPGVPRIGIVTTYSTVPPEQDDAVRAQLYEMLYGNRETSAVEAALLKEKLDRNIVSESKLTGCDYVLFLSLDSTIKPASQKGNGALKQAVRVGGEALGIANRSSDYYSETARITYRGYQIADSLQNSTALLDSITKATDKKDKVGIKFRVIKVSDNGAIISETTKERTAQKKQEPILQNLLIEIGNQVLNSIPNP